MERASGRWRAGWYAWDMPPQYKFVELTPVTDETIETCVNEWVALGWDLEGIRFVTTEHSKRPGMAFVSFVREAPQAVVDGEPPRRPPPLVKPESRGPESRGNGSHGTDKPEAPAGEPAVIVAAHGTDVD